MMSMQQNRHIYLLRSFRDNPMRKSTKLQNAFTSCSGEIEKDHEVQLTMAKKIPLQRS